LNCEKVHLAQSEIKFLGHSLSGDGIKILLERVEAIVQFCSLKNLKAVCRFLGMVIFYASFVKDLSHIAEPLHALRCMKVRLVWAEPRGKAFEELKNLISTPPVLQVPDFAKEFVLVTHSSDVAISAALTNDRGSVSFP
jgi:hypothetical protein